MGRATAYSLTGIILFCLPLISCGSDGKGYRHGKRYYLAEQYSVFSDDRAYFSRSIAAAQSRLSASARNPAFAGKGVRIGIVSHHLLIRNLIAEYVLRLAEESHPKTIILLGPNHASRGPYRVTISELPWKTPFGLVQPDRALARELEGIASVDEDAFYNEHSIGALVPFIRYVFPRSKIVPLIFRSDTDTATAAMLARILASRCSEDVLIIASLDFSHYKTSAVAMEQDSATFEIIREFDVSRYREAFVDSRPVLYTVLAICRELQLTRIEVIHHTNSALEEGKPEELCTSYMNLFFR